MKFAKPPIGPLAELLEQGSRKAQSLGSDVLVSYSQAHELIDPLDLFADSERGAADRWYWGRESEGLAIVAVGTLAGSTPPRNVRFEEVERTRRQYASSVSIAAENVPRDTVPLLFAGFSFDPVKTQDRLVWQGFPSTFLLTPRLTIIRRGDDCTLTVNAVIGPRTSPSAMFKSTEQFLEELVSAVEKQRVNDLIIDELPPDDAAEREARQYASALLRAESAIRKNEVEHLTVTRRRTFTTGGLFRIGRVLEYLRNAQPDAHIVAAGRHGATFVGYAHGALVNTRGNEVQTECLSGKSRRGDTPEFDDALASNLADNESALELHEISVDHRLEVLEAICDDVNEPDEPVIATSADHHHLYSELTATSQKPDTLFQLSGKLHPPLEASGEPREEAKAFLLGNESVDRGWSSGLVGYVDLHGNGTMLVPEFSAVIRAPILDQQRAYLFARTTVSSGIDPEDALAEAERDLTTLKRALSQ